MALVQCSDCEKQVSTNAESCPHCGNPHLSGPEQDSAPLFADGPYSPTEASRGGALEALNESLVNERIRAELMPNEKVLYQARLYKGYLTGGIALAVIAGLITLLAGVASLGGSSDSASDSSGMICMLAFAAPLFFGAIYRILSYRNTLYVLTNKRIISDIGVFNREIGELPLSKIEHVSVKQTFSDRFNKSGTVMVRGTGLGMSIFKQIGNPLEFRKAIQSQAHLS